MISSSCKVTEVFKCPSPHSRSYCSKCPWRRICLTLSLCAPSSIPPLQAPPILHTLPLAAEGGRRPPKPPRQHQGHRPRQMFKGHHDLAAASELWLGSLHWQSGTAAQRSLNTRMNYDCASLPSLLGQPSPDGLKAHEQEGSVGQSLVHFPHHLLSRALRCPYLAHRCSCNLNGVRTSSLES